MINLLIDRVGNVNIFNFMDQTGNSESHIHSKIDSDLLQEYVREIENIARISRSVRSREVIGVKPDTLKELKSLGETFFDQFFPLEIAEKLRSSGDKFLHFNIDQGLKDIPWELLYDGSGFLGDKFFIGKTVKGAARSNAVEDNRKLKMLIIADPNEDLE